ncbi:hypothetical protein P170DRAFT_312363, partial [Aspergillus steynii IBT 23096]
DFNIYALSRISNYNIVLACLLAEITGSVSAAIIIKDMICSFPAVRFGLIVGIGSGVLYYSA